LVTTPRVGVLALQGDVREHVAMFAAVGVEATPVRRADELAAVDGIVIPGGESTTIGKLLQVFELLEPLQKAVAAGLPAYGSCAGMILLADRFVDGRCDGRIVAVRQQSLLATAFHPELSDDLRVHRLFGEIVREASS
jgi:5'-phosphate synthase pdxT subunit